MRVSVWNGDQSRYLGDGEYNEFTVAYVVMQPDGSLRSMPDASQYPSQELEATGTVQRCENNPVIVLDSGQTVFGCQVWWSRVADGPPDVRYTNVEPDMAKMLDLAQRAVEKYKDN